ncbi:MAG: hypothetical protein LM565_01915 [Thermofilum sp.]|jgi:hypothetical protein|nr:hypothetical protein [Thermofilum sp.]
MGRVAKGVLCSVKDCSEKAVRSVSRDMLERSGMKVELKEGVGGRVYLCRSHYKEYKKLYRRNVWKVEKFAR